MTEHPSGPDAAAEAGDPGLKEDAIGFVDGLIIGIASTAPAYSLAAVLAIVVVGVGVQAPAVLLASFVPMFLIASAFYVNRGTEPLLLLGVVLMVSWRLGPHDRFFRRDTETVNHEVAAGRKLGVAAVPGEAI
jgi:hypothetical protein